MSKLINLNDKMSIGHDFDMFAYDETETEEKVQEWKDQGDLDSAKGRYDMAINWYSLVLDSEPRNVGLLLMKALMHLTAGDPREADAYIDRAFEITPTLVGAHYLKGLVCARLGKTEDAQVCADFLTDIKCRDWKHQILQAMKVPPRVSEIPALGTVEEVSQMINEQFMIDSWHLNKWWYTPNSFANPNPNYNTQLDFICGKNWNKFFQEKNVTEYKSMNFSHKINILRGPSITMHPVVSREPINNDFEKLCQFHEGVPDVLIWAPDIPCI